MENKITFKDIFGLRRVHCNSKQDPYPKVIISKIVEVNEVE